MYETIKILAFKAITYICIILLKVMNRNHMSPRTPSLGQVLIELRSSHVQCNQLIPSKFGSASTHTSLPSDSFHDDHESCLSPLDLLKQSQ